MSRRVKLALAGFFLALASMDFFAPCWPDTPGATAADSAWIGDEIAALPVCVVSLGWSAGALAKSILYRARVDGDHLDVGYFVYWSTERPWGNIAMSHAVVPAMLTDAIYSHFLFLFPGLQRMLYGPGDIEGFRIRYRRDRDRWIPVAGRADDGFHHPVALGSEEFVDSRGRVVVMTSIWSHQLGAHGAVRAAASGASETCFSGSEIRALDEATARAFRLGTPDHPRRAQPGWVL